MAINNSAKNSLVKMVNDQRLFTNHEITRRGTPGQNSAAYRRNDINNLGAKQFMGICYDEEIFRIGVGGPYIVS